MSDCDRCDAVVVGAGFAGLYMVHRLTRMGLSVRAYEAGDGVGGTWYWNRYPGCRCDVESLDYSYSFDPELEQDWTWTERYPAQAEVERYLNHVADRFGLRRHIRLRTRVTAAGYDESARRWTVETDTGEVVSARFCILAVGCLSNRNVPDLPGLPTFGGTVSHTGAWPAEGIGFTGQRVGVIGTGSSGVQVIPPIARQAAHLHVFQRTPHFVVPANNHPLAAAASDERKARYPAHREMLRGGFFGFTLAVNPQSALEATPEEREAAYEAAWQRGGPALLGTFGDLIVDPDANATAADFVRRKITETVHDPEVAERLCPRDYPIGTKRLVQGTGYYETYNRPNVTLVDLRREPLREVTGAGVRTAEREYALDALVLATGYDAVTGPIRAIDIRGRGGRALRDKWADGPHTHLGVASAGFPNLFMITGPASPSVVSNVVLSIEQHVDWIADCLRHLSDHDLATIEPTAEAEAAWMAHTAEVAEATLFPRADSWYLGANIPGKPRVFLAYLGGVGEYRRHCEEVVAGGYAGFVTEPARRAPSARAASLAHPTSG